MDTTRVKSAVQDPSSRQSEGPWHIHGWPTNSNARFMMLQFRHGVEAGETKASSD